MKRLVLVLSLLSVMIGISNAAEDIAIAREGVQWVYYEYKFHQMDDGEWVPTYYPIVYEFKTDETDRASEYKVLWEDRTYEVNYTGIIKRDITPVAKVCDKYYDHVAPFGGGGTFKYEEHYVLAKRIGSQEPLTGHYAGYDEEGLIYKVYSLPFINDHFDRTKMTKKQRDELFTIVGGGMITMEDGTERKCYNSKHSAFKFIEGIGFVRTDWGESDEALVNTLNFIDLDIKIISSYRILSHVIENGEIIFKSPRYEEILPYVYNPDNQNENTGIDDIAAAKPALTDGAYYDMQGRRMSEPTAPGIYIHNGKKVVIK